MNIVVFLNQKQRSHHMFDPIGGDNVYHSTLTLYWMSYLLFTYAVMVHVYT